jgi:hypothetical protein
LDADAGRASVSAEAQYLSADSLRSIDRLLFNESINVDGFGAILVRGDAPDLGAIMPTVDGKFRRSWLADFFQADARRVTTLIDDAVIHFRECNREDKRHFGGMWPNMVYMRCALLSENLHAECCYAKLPGGWAALERGKRPRLLNGDELTRHLVWMHQAVTVHLERRYSWSCQLRVDAGPTLEFLTTSEDAREIFRFRDKPPSGGRRPALRHWVSQIGRRGEPWYLRGAVDFAWEGVACKLLPPQFEREQIAVRKAVVLK